MSKLSLFRTLKTKVVENFALGCDMTYNYMSTRKPLAKRGSVDYIVNVLIVLVMAGSLLGIAFANLNTLKNDGNFSTAEKSLLGVVGVAVIISLVRYFLKGTGSRS